MTGNAKIESLGVYIPPAVVTTDELLDSCKHRPRLDLERITGIRERHVAEGEYAADLGIKAAERALDMSRYSASDLEMIICTSISKYNQEQAVDFEPATSVAIRRAIGASNAINFDIVNACAGMFNGILVLESFIR
ncbi:3-oxoacyl-ACP synthase III family protein, partial [Gemmatimonadota bacterium]